MDEKELQALYEAMGKKLGLGDFQSFKNQLTTDDKFRKAFHEEASHELDLGDYNTFDQRVKKKVSSNVPATTLEAGSSVTPNPETEIPLVSLEDNETANPIDLASQYNELKNKTVEGVQGGSTYAMGSTSAIPDENSIKKANDLKEFLKINRGLDADALYNETKDFPKEAYDWKMTDERGNEVQPYSKENLIKLRQENPTAYYDKINGVKTQYEIAKKTGSWNLANEFINLKRSAQNVDEFVDNVHKQKEIIGKVFDSFDEVQSANERLKSEAYTISPATKGFPESYKSSGLSEKLSPYEYAGLLTLKAFEPEKYKQTIDFINTPIKDVYHHQMPSSVTNNMQAPVAMSTSFDSPEKTIGGKAGSLSQGTIDQKIGLENRMMELSEIGKSNYFQYIQKNNKELDEQINKLDDNDINKSLLINQYNSNVNDLNKAISEGENDNARYPLSTALKFDRQVADMTQKEPGLLNTAAIKFALQTDKPRKAFENIFGDSPALQMQRLGEDESISQFTYLPEEYRRQNSPIIPVYPKELESAVKQISTDKDLSYEQKQSKIKDLLTANQSKIKIITNPNEGKSKNFFSKATAYTMADFFGNIGGMAFTMAGLPIKGIPKEVIGMGLLFHNDHFTEAVRKGYSNPNEYAALHSGIDMLAATFGTQYQAVKKMISGNPTAKNVLSEVTEDVWNKAVSKDRDIIEKLGGAIKSSLAENGKMVAMWGGAVPALHNVANNTFGKENKSTADILDESFKSMKEMAIGQLPLALAGAYTGYKRESTLRKSLLWDIGDNADIELQRTKDLEATGKLTPEKAAQRTQTIKEVSKLVDLVPSTDRKGKPLTDDARMDYLYNLYIKNKAKTESGLPDKQKAEAEKTAIVADHLNNDILSSQTDIQLENRKKQIQKKLEEKDDEGKLVIKDKEKAELEAEKEAIELIAEERRASSTTVSSGVKREDAENKVMTAGLSGNRTIADLIKETGKEYDFIDLGDGLVAFKMKDQSGSVQTYNVADLNNLTKDGFAPSYSIHKNYKGEFGEANKANVRDIAKANGQDESVISSRLSDARKRLIESENKPIQNEPVKEEPVSAVSSEAENTDITDLRKAKTKTEVESAILKATQSDNLKDGLDVAENLIGKSMYKAIFYSDPIKFGNELADAIEQITNKKGQKKSENKPIQNEPIKEGAESTQPIPTEEVKPTEASPVENIEPAAEGEEKVTGVKKAITDETRAANGMPKVEFAKMNSDIDALQEAKERVDSGKVNPQEMVNRILTEKGNYKNEGEVMDMQYYAHQLERRNKELSQQLAEAKTPEEEADVRGQKLQLSDLMDAQTEAARTAGNQWGKTGNRMQPVINDAGQIFRDDKATIKEAYGGEVPADVKVKLDAITKERDDAIAAKEKVEEQLRQKMAERGFEQFKEEARKQKKRNETKEALKKEADDLLKELKDEIKGKNSDVQRQGGLPLSDKAIVLVGKLAVNYIKQGAVGLEALVDKLYENVKDDLSGISRKQIKDIIANYEPAQAQKEIERLTKKAQILEDKLTPPSVKTKGDKFTPSEPTDFAKPSKEAKVFRTNNEWVKANQRVANAEFRMKIEKRKAFESQKNWYQRGLAWAGRLTRLSVLSGYNVLGKLAAAATIGAAGKRIPEQAIGAVYSTIFKGIAEKAPIEGFLNAKSEAKWYKEFFNPKKFAKNAWDILKTGSTDLGRRLGSAEYEHVPGLYVPTDLHQIIKDPVKRATFEASFRNGMIWAEKNGLDINDPLVINSLENAAYKRAQYEIFQEQNWLSKKFTSYKSSLEKAGNMGATGKFLVDFMIPVSTVPANIVRRVTTTSPLGLIRGGKEVVDAYRKGIEKLTPDEADHVMKQLKQGTLGTALWLLGWYGYQSFGGLYSQFNPNKKREEGDKVSDVMVIDGKEIPKPAQHALPLEVIQMAATARRIYENYKENRNAETPKALAMAGLGAIGAGLEQIPVIETPIHAITATKDPIEAEKLTEDIGRRFKPQILRETGVIGKKEATRATEFLSTKKLKIVDPHKENLHPVDENGEKIKITDEIFENYKAKREEKIQQEVNDLMDKGKLLYVNEEGKLINKSLDEATEKEIQGWLMNKSSKATKEATEELFGRQPEKQSKEYF